MEQYQANSELGSPMLLSNQSDVSMWGWMIPTVIVTITRIEVSANQVDYAESGYVFVIGRARPLVTFTRLDTTLLPTTGRRSGRKDGEILEQD